MADLFAILNDISENKKWIVDDFKGYPAFMINKGLSQHMDTVLYAAEMNKYPNISPRMHYDFLMAMVPARKRRGKWAKGSKRDENARLLMDYYSFSYKKALEALDVLSPEQLNNIKDKNNVGGIKRGRSR